MNVVVSHPFVVMFLLLMYIKRQTLLDLCIWKMLDPKRITLHTIYFYQFMHFLGIKPSFRHALLFELQEKGLKQTVLVQS